MTPSDEDLLAKARTGDRKAFRQLVERYEGKVAATVIGMLGRCPEADDVGQEVFVRFYRAMDRFRGDSSLGTYLTRIAINQSIKEIKKRQTWMERFSTREISTLTDAVSDDGRDSVEAVDRAELVNKALAKLSPEHRAVTVLRMVEGYSTKEAAAILDVPEGTVMSRLSRAMKTLEALLRPELETP